MVDVSIIIPTHNRAHLVSRAIDSARAQGGGAGPRLQVIVVDDASTDATGELLHRYGGQVEMVSLKTNAGSGNARNQGLSRATGRYVKFLDSDDVLVDGVLAEELELAERERADMVVTGWGGRMIDAQGSPIPGTIREYPAPDMDPLPDTVLWGRAAPTSSVLYRASYIRDLRWDREVPKLDDWDWFVRAALRMGRIVTLQRTAYWMQGHGGPQITTTASMLEQARAHHLILGKMEEWLRGSGHWTEARARRLAQYYYKELRVLCVHDRPAFERALAHIYQLDPTFVPVDEERQPYMRVLTRMFGVRNTLLAHTALKKTLKKERHAVR